MTSADTILTSIVEEVTHERGFTTTSYLLSGEVHAAVIVQATYDAYVEQYGEVDPERLAALDGKPVTILKSGATMFGASTISVLEGKLFKGGAAYLPKGARKKGYRLDPATVLDVVPGYGHGDEFRAKVLEVRARFPQLKALTPGTARRAPRSSTRQPITATASCRTNGCKPQSTARPARWTAATSPRAATADGPRRSGSTERSRSTIGTSPPSSARCSHGDSERTMRFSPLGSPVGHADPDPPRTTPAPHIGAGWGGTRRKAQ